MAKRPYRITEAERLRRSEIMKRRWEEGSSDLGPGKLSREAHEARLRKIRESRNVVDLGEKINAEVATPLASDGESEAVQRIFDRHRASTSNWQSGSWIDAAKNS